MEDSELLLPGISTPRCSASTTTKRQIREKEAEDGELEEAPTRGAIRRRQEYKETRCPNFEGICYIIGKENRHFKVIREEINKQAYRIARNRGKVETVDQPLFIFFQGWVLHGTNEQFLKTSRRRQRSNQELVVPTQTMPVTATLAIASVLAPLPAIIYIRDSNRSRERTLPLSMSNNPLLPRQYPPQFDYGPLLIQSSSLRNTGVDNTTLLEQFRDQLRTNGSIITLMECVIDIVIELEMTLDQLKRTYVRDLRALGFVTSPFL